MSQTTQLKVWDTIVCFFNSCPRKRVVGVRTGSLMIPWSGKVSIFEVALMVLSGERTTVVVVVTRSWILPEEVATC